MKSSEFNSAFFKIHTFTTTIVFLVFCLVTGLSFAQEEPYQYNAIGIETSINKLRVSQNPTNGYAASLGLNYKRKFKSKRVIFNFGIRVFKTEYKTEKYIRQLFGSDKDTLTSFKINTIAVDFPARFDFNLYTGEKFNLYTGVGLLYSSIALRRRTQYFYESSSGSLVGENLPEKIKPYRTNFIGLIFCLGGETRLNRNINLSFEMVFTGRGVLEYAEGSGFGTFGLHVGIFRRF